MEALKLPFRAEYAKSGRAGCKGCQNTIAKDSLRLAAMVQSPFFDGLQPKWYHFSCFFNKCRPKTTADIAHFESIRWEDQEAIKKKLESTINCIVPDTSKSKGSKSKKRITDTVAVKQLIDFTMEYAKSNRAKCKVCEENIGKGEIRISKKDFDGETALRFGPVERWHHVDCFLKAREELEYFVSGEFLPGFKSLKAEDKKMIKKKIPELPRPAGADDTDGPTPAKKLKTDEDEALNKKLKRQNQAIFKYHDLLQQLKSSELQLLLEHNKQEIPEGPARMIERLSDAMAFGALNKCEKCKGQFKFVSGRGYVCTGYANEWVKCEFVTVNPQRFAFTVPEDLKEKYKFLKSFKGKVTDRIFNEKIKTENSSTVMNGSKKYPILKSFKFFIHKTDEISSDDLKKRITSLGGSVTKKYEEDVLAVISTNAAIEKSKMSKTLEEAKASCTPVLPGSFFNNITSSTSREEFISKISEMKISPWDSDVSKKMKPNVEQVSKSRQSTAFKSNETVKKVTLKDGLAVDPDSQLEGIAHVYRNKNDIYSAVLSLVDIQSGKNSYYKMQILESDDKKKYWFFRAWGRIGTTIGGNKCDRYSTLDDCIQLFKESFEEQTGNEWDNRKNFKKVPGKKIMHDVEYKQVQELLLVPETKDTKPVAKSNTLSQSVQNLISLLFDTEAMKRTMLEFELDLNKMPLGKLSQKQIHSAFEILSTLQNISKDTSDRKVLIEKTNKFYSLVPHDFGINSPPLLDNEEIITQKIDMLNSLMDIEIAYKLLQDCEESDKSIDDCYSKLNTKIIDLDPKSDEYKTIELYVKNTHAKTHSNYTLDIENVFKIERKGEAQRYKKFKKLSNKKLLWHGSRVTNFAGILSQGLRIAPPEAPVTGYMFGKGIYFADMVSKSANYCCTSKKNSTGLMLLCEVALGEMLELTQAENIEKLPTGKDSVKGLGRTHPDPSEVVMTPTGVEVPVGKGVDANLKKKTALLYNEYPFQLFFYVAV
ncbi:hypothetical protein RUM43_013028 [Polyplax serrata]|uniref:Poly [ADP-ribose] polymerase n=1 Tax=Polyplax serrata TaxID=468196 RepID=A0AAN8S2X3_POLSC